MSDKLREIQEREWPAERTELRRESVVLELDWLKRPSPEDWAWKLIFVIFYR